MKLISSLSCFLLILIVGGEIAVSQHQVDFRSDKFKVVNGDVTEYLESTAFMGTAYIDDVRFTNGIIEVDMAVTGQRSYPGIFFRVQSPNDYEHFYVRPHRAGLYPDALQYTPNSNGIGAWQLFNGKGCTASAVFPENEWFHLRMEIKGERANVYINNNPVPELEIYHLYHGASEGGISLNSPANGTAYFSNLSYTITEDIFFDPAPVPDHPVGLINDWEITQVFSTVDIQMDQTPGQQDLKNIQWEKAEMDPNGLINIGKYRSRQGRAPDFVYCRTTLFAEKDTLLELKYGYSDAIVIFLNGQPMAYGNSAYTQRDPSFLGIIGLNDAVYLPLKKGNNELMLSVAESFGGWGFLCQKGNAVFMGEGIEPLWKTGKEFKVSESVLYDPKRQVLYVTNFDQFRMENPAVTQSISKLDLRGNIIDLNWISGLNNPLGMTLSKDKLYVAERGTIAQVDLETGDVLSRIDVPESQFLNDVAIDSKGIIYSSDSRKNVIWRIENNQPEKWLVGEKVIDPNVLYMDGDNLLFGNSGDSWLKSVDPETKSISNIARFPEGFIDGIRPDGKGNLLVSLWKGKLYSVDQNGTIHLILHTVNTGDYIADFEYIPDRKMLIVPTFYNNTVTSYSF